MQKENFSAPEKRHPLFKHSRSHFNVEKVHYFQPYILTEACSQERRIQAFLDSEDIFQECVDEFLTQEFQKNSATGKILRLRHQGSQSSSAVSSLLLKRKKPNLSIKHPRMDERKLQSKNS